MYEIHRDVVQMDRVKCIVPVDVVDYTYSLVVDVFFPRG